MFERSGKKTLIVIPISPTIASLSLHSVFSVSCLSLLLLYRNVLARLPTSYGKSVISHVQSVPLSYIPTAVFSYSSWWFREGTAQNWNEVSNWREVAAARPRIKSFKLLVHRVSRGLNIGAAGPSACYAETFSRHLSLMWWWIVNYFSSPAVDVEQAGAWLMQLWENIWIKCKMFHLGHRGGKKKNRRHQREKSMSWSAERGEEEQRERIWEEMAWNDRKTRRELTCIQIKWSWLEVDVQGRRWKAQSSVIWQFYLKSLLQPSQKKEES